MMFYIKTQDRIIFVPAIVAFAVIILAGFGVYEVLRIVFAVIVSFFSGSVFVRFF
jgi:hypothetical protein